MTSVEVSKRIGMPVVNVFRTFTDIEHGPQHVSAIKKIEMLTPGRVGLGTRWRETRDVFGRLDDADMEITAFERNRTYTITHTKVGIRIDTIFRFRPAPGGTDVTVEFALRSGGVPPGFFSPLGWVLESAATDVLKHELEDLKHVLEH